MKERYKNLNANDKCLLWMGIVFGVVLVLMIPLFFFTLEDGYPLMAIPFGWILGSAAEIISFVTISWMSKSIANPNAKGGSAIFSALLRVVIYAGVLLLSAISTFRSDMLGGFNYINFFSTAAGLLPMLAIIFIIQKRASQNPADQIKGSMKEPEVVKQVEKKEEVTFNEVEAPKASSLGMSKKGKGKGNRK